MKENYVVMPMSMVMDFALAVGFMESVKVLESKTDIKLTGYALAISLIKAEGSALIAQAQNSNIMYASRKGVEISSTLKMVTGEHCAYLIGSGKQDGELLHGELHEIEESINNTGKDAERYRKWVRLIELEPATVAKAISECIYKEDYDEALDSL